MSESYGQFGWLPEPDYIISDGYSLDIDLFEFSTDPIDLRFPGAEIWDQGSLPTCTAHAVAAAYQIAQYQRGKLIVEPSRLFIYWNSLEPSNAQGSILRVAISAAFGAMQKYGVCSEETWPSFEQYARKKPTKSAFTEARQYIISAGKPLGQNLSQLVGYLRSKRPFVFGLSIFPGYYSDEVSRTGIIPSPDFTSEVPVDYHAVTAVGYQNGSFIFQNSRGDSWGQNGFGFISSELMLNPRFAKNFMGFPSL